MFACFDVWLHRATRYVVKGCASGCGLVNSRVLSNVHLHPAILERRLGVGMGPSHFSSRWTLRTASEGLGYRLSRKASSESYSGYLRTASDSASASFHLLFSDVGYIGSRTESSDSVCDESSTAATSTGSPSHLVERYQKMSMPPLAEGKLRCAWA